MKRRKNGGENAIKITKHAQCYYTGIDLFLKHTLAEKSRSERFENAPENKRKAKSGAEIETAFETFAIAHKT